MEKKNDFVLVDLRSEQEYKKEHIIGALNIPAYKTPDKSAYDEEDRIVDAFKKIIAENPNKEIIVHCYSSACMTGRKIGKILSHHDIYGGIHGISGITMEKPQVRWRTILCPKLIPAKIKPMNRAFARSEILIANILFCAISRV
jgi:rhodanese-related sulfurtransferase